MKILVVEDNELKRERLVQLLKTRNIEMHFCKSVGPALRYVIQNQDNISGIILDLGLTTFDDSRDYDQVKGLDIADTLEVEGIDIPILINSSTKLSDELKEGYENVFGHVCMDYMAKKEDYEKFDAFIASLQEKKQ